MLAGRTNIVLLVFSWTACLLASAAITFFLQRSSALQGDAVRWEVWVIWILPVWMIAGANLFFGSRSWMQATVVVITVILVPTTVLACYSQTQLTIDMHNARLAGGRMMRCGPPLELCALFPIYLLSFSLFVLSLMQLHSHLSNVGNASRN